MNQSQSVIRALAESNNGFGQGPARDMALVLFVDGFVSVAENEGIAGFSTGPGAQLEDVVLGFLAQKGLDVDKYLDTALMEKVIKLVDEFWGGKLTVQDLWDEYPDAITGMIMGFSGHGVSLTDDPSVVAKLRAFGIGDPHDAPVKSAVRALGIEDWGYNAGTDAKDDVEKKA